MLLERAARFNAEQGYARDAARVRDALGELLRRPELGQAFTIERGGEPVGYALLCFGWSLEWGGRDAFLDEFYVEPGHRGQGVGAAALAALLEAARTLGVRAVHLEVESGNEAGQRLYRATGFTGNDRSILTRRLDG